MEKIQDPDPVKLLNYLDGQERGLSFSTYYVWGKKKLNHYCFLSGLIDAFAR